MYVLQSIWETLKIAVAEWFPLYQSIDLGIIGKIMSGLSLFALLISAIAYLKKHFIL